MAEDFAIVDLVNAANPNCVTVGAAPPKPLSIFVITEGHQQIRSGNLIQLILLVVSQSLAAASGHVATGIIGIVDAIRAGHGVRFCAVLI